MTVSPSQPRRGVHILRAILVAVLLAPYCMVWIELSSISIFGPRRVNPIMVGVILASAFAGVLWAGVRGPRTRRLWLACLTPVALGVLVAVVRGNAASGVGEALAFGAVWLAMTVVIPMGVAALVRVFWTDGVVKAPVSRDDRPPLYVQPQPVPQIVAAPAAPAAPAPLSVALPSRSVLGPLPLPLKDDGYDGIRQALNQQNLDQARALLREALREPSAELYYLAAFAALDAAQRVDFLQQAIALDPFHIQAQAYFG